MTNPTCPECGSSDYREVSPGVYECHDCWYGEDVGPDQAYEDDLLRRMEDASDNEE